MLIYFRDDEGDHIVDIGRAAEIVADTADVVSELLIAMAEDAEVDIAWAERRELEVMQHTCARCPAREACRGYLAGGSKADRAEFCGNAPLFDMLWVRAAVEGGWLD